VFQSHGEGWRSVRAFRDKITSLAPRRIVTERIYRILDSFQRAITTFSKIFPTKNSKRFREPPAHSLNETHENITESFLGSQKVSFSLDYTFQKENASLQYMNVYHIY
jgi:hypothetical protein